MISILIRNEEQYNIVKNYNLDCIYTDNLNLANKYNLYYEVPRTYNKLTNLPSKLLINDTGLLTENNKTIITNYSLNVANKETISLLMKYNVKKITLSIEVTLEELKFMDIVNYPIEVIIYGKVLAMFIKSHPIIKDSNYELVDYQNHKYPIKVDEEEHLSIYHYEPINNIDKINEYQKLGIKYFRLDFLDEDIKEIKKILDSIF